MPQIFHRSTNTISRLSIVAGVLVVGFSFFVALQMQRSSYFSWQGVSREQPVPFSHQHHVAGVGIDCRYCHTSVEVSGFAGIPPTKTCMNCHSQIWTNAQLLEPVRASFRTNTPLRWQRVNQLPNFVYFDHSIHINKGVGCATCHGPVDRMPLMLEQQSMQMEWCLDCHREPEKNLRPRSEVFNMNYAQPSTLTPVTVDGRVFTDQLALGTYLRQEYHLRSVYDITSCSTCHR